MVRHLSLSWYFAAAVALGAGTGIAHSLGYQFDAPLWVGVIMLVFGMPFAIWWWKRADEAVREAHKWAWFWGGGFGLLAGLALGMADARLKLGWLGPLFSHYAGTPLSAFEGGMLFLMLTTATGYMIAWAIWWKRHQ